jgi:hypothetical protein
VRAGGLTTRASVDIARPPLADSSGLDWKSNAPISPGPQARVTNMDDLAGWQQNLLPVGVMLGIGA